MKTGVIGLGAMGAPMASRLAQAGWLHRIWNRTDSRSRAFAEQYGTTIADDCAALARDCELIILSVSADRDVLDLLEQMSPALTPGKIILDTSTVSPQTALSAAIKVASHGCRFLDAPVSGGVEGARNGQLSMMIGGEQDTIEQAREVLAAVATRITHMGPTGSGQGTKAVNQIMAAGINQAVTEALAFGQGLGLDMDKVVDVVSAGAAGNWFLQHRGKSMLQNRFDTGFRLALHHKDLEICMHSAGAATGSLPLTEKTLADYEELMQAGYGNEDISALFRLKRRHD